MIAASRRFAVAERAATPSSFESGIGQLDQLYAENRMSFSAKPWAYSDIPSFSSQCSVFCITTQHPAELMFSGPTGWAILPDGSRRFARETGPNACAAGSPGRLASSEHRSHAPFPVAPENMCRTSSAAGRGPAGGCVSSGRPFFDRNLELAVSFGSEIVARALDRPSACYPCRQRPDGQSNEGGSEL